jgi:hypothetical protein
MLNTAFPVYCITDILPKKFNVGAVIYFYVVPADTQKLGQHTLTITG